MNLLQLFYPPRREPLGHLPATHFSDKRPPRLANPGTGGLRLPSRAGGPRQRPAGRGGVVPAANAVGSQRPPASGLWSAAAWVEFVADFFLAAEWALGLLYPLDALLDLWSRPRPAARPPLESTPVLAAALLDDHAYYLALLTTEPVGPLSATQRDDLLYHHQRMAWMLRTYLA